MSKFGVKGMRYDFPKPSNIEVSGNPLRAMNETNIKLAKVLYIRRDLLSIVKFPIQSKTLWSQLQTGSSKKSDFWEKSDFLALAHHSLYSLPPF
jgi:hypothetical protein